MTPTRAKKGPVVRGLVVALVGLTAQAAILAIINPPPWSGAEAGLMLLCALAGTGISLLVARALVVRAVPEVPADPGPARDAYLALALGVSHEVRQPLFAIQLMARNALEQASDGQAAEDQPMHSALRRIAAQTEKAIAVVNRTLDLARQLPQQSERVELRSAIETCLADWRETSSEPSIETTVTIADDLPEDVHAVIDPTGLRQVIANALDNAAASIARRQQSGWTGQGRIEIELACRPGWISCFIRDNGAGVSGEVRNRAFEPFQSTKSGKVGGLGLFLSREIIAGAGGTIELYPGGEDGAVLAIGLRRA